ncbi:PaaI family thioesterase [Erythrobacteraceae bacterium CFH 75059]|uniref:PaaI family thioesterase n=1 Tax=Qipengyuania thermophila TaxID=2509361 RepID=UPI0010204C3F|nr:PaaI family thioesterase [Qipengyuania thermophila]TCD05079.1 PaaI family thioesterase [Erythrobacteraceae bacterium CFH 75059]
MSEAQAPGGPAPAVIPHGEWAGWSTWASDAFEQRAGPFYQRADAQGRRICAFLAGPEHLNGGGFVHGGCLLTFADFALFAIATDALGGQQGVTMNLSADFLAPARAGQRIEATGEVTRAGGKTIYVRGIATADAEPVLSFSGIIRKVR